MEEFSKHLRCRKYYILFRWTGRWHASGREAIIYRHIIVVAYQLNASGWVIKGETEGVTYVSMAHSQHTCGEIPYLRGRQSGERGDSV